MNINGTLLHENTTPPDIIQQLLSTVHPVRVTHKEMQEPKLGRRKIQGRVVNFNPVTDRIQRQTVVSDWLFVAVDLAAAQYCIDSGDKFAR